MYLLIRQYEYIFILVTLYFSLASIEIYIHVISKKVITSIAIFSLPLIVYGVHMD